MNTTKKIIFLLGIVFFFSMKVCAQTYQDDDFIVTCGGKEENMGYVHDGKFIEGIKRCYNISQNTEFTFTWYNSQEETKIEDSGLVPVPLSYDLTLENHNVLMLTLEPGVYDMTFQYYGWENPQKMKVLIEYHTHKLSQNSTEATCTTAGYPVQCDGCKAWLWDENTTTYENEYKPILGHDFTNQTWTTDGVNGGKYRTCTRSGCGDRKSVV